MSAPQPPGTGLPAAPKPAGRRPVNQRLIVGIVIALALAMVAAGIVTSRVRDRGTLRKAREVVEDYLTAVAEGDADRARSHLDTSRNYSGDDSLLTDEVLRASKERAPMSGIDVGEATKDQDRSATYHVPVSYTVGEDTVSTAVEVQVISSHDDPVVISLTRLKLDQFRGVEVMVNGVTARSNAPAVFPGSYALAPASEYLEIVRGDVAATDVAKEDYTPSKESHLTVSEAGVQLFRDKVVAEAERCLASTRLDPGCGAVLPQYPDPALYFECTEVGEDSVHRWQEPEEAARLHSVTPEPKIGSPTVIRADRDQLGRIRLTATCRQGDTWSEREMDRYDPGTRFGSPSLDLTDPDRKIMWTT